MLSPSLSCKYAFIGKNQLGDRRLRPELLRGERALRSMALQQFCKDRPHVSWPQESPLVVSLHMQAQGALNRFLCNIRLYIDIEANPMQQWRPMQLLDTSPDQATMSYQQTSTICFYRWHQPVNQPTHAISIKCTLSSGLRPEQAGTHDKLKTSLVSSNQSVCAHRNMAGCRHLLYL